jgi:hydroxymethylbilane synthase
LWTAGGKGLWVKEIEAALLAGEIDLAVHSMKDVPGALAEGLAVVAVPARADVRDAVVSRSGLKLDQLPASARLGTTSLRRACQLKAFRSDFHIEILRGNLDTRLRKVADGVVDAAILACAGLDRLAFADRIAERLSVERMLPAVGQGALAIEARSADARVRSLTEALNHQETALAVAAERAFLARLGASCRTPVAGYAQLVGGQVVLRGLVGRPDGTQLIADMIAGDPKRAEELGVSLADTLLGRGAGAILAECN